MRLLDRIFKGRKPSRLNKLAGALLNLSFINTNKLDPRITFGRTSNATVTGPNGLVSYAPMNLLTYSEQFDNAAWQRARTDITANSTVAPNSTQTADTLTVNTTSASGAPTYTTALVGTQNGTYTFSVYIKQASTNYIRIGAFNGANAAFAYVNLATLIVGTTGTAGAGLSYVSATAVAVQNGFVRCSLVFSSTISGFYPIIHSCCAADNDVTCTSGNTSTFWGAQLELGSTATTYNPTTVKNLLGYTEHFDNAAWTKSNAFVQTNLVLQSQNFENAYWGKTNATVTADTVAAPDGTLTAETLSDGAAAGLHYTESTAQTLTGTFTASVYAKKGSSNFIGVYAQGVSQGVFFNLNTGAFSSNIVGAPAAYSITPVSDGWYRCTITFAASAASVSVRLFTSTDGSTFNYTGNNNTVYIWGAQLVQGTSAGDYKAAYATAAAVGYSDIYGQPFAQKLVEDTATNTHRVRQTVTVSSSPQTFSVYAKAAERSWVYLVDASITNGFCYFNLAAGAKGTQGANAVGEITDMGNGWYRCSIRVTLLGGGDTFDIRVATADGTNSYTGDGTSGIYIFGAQLSDSASVDPYVYNPVAAPTAQAYYGPRFDYDPVTLAPKGLLIEEQRTNLVLQSQTFKITPWSSYLSTTVANAAVAPDGTTTATSMIVTGQYGNISQTVTVSANTTYTYSCYVRVPTGSTALIMQSFDGTSYTNVSLNVGSTWTRVTRTVTTGAAATTLTLQIIDNSASAWVGVQIWGAQLEAGAFATSYIPTGASQVTRAADSASMIGNNFARWYNVNTGTAFIDYATFASGSITLPVMEFSDGTPSNRTLFQNNPATNSRVLAFVGGSAVVTTLDATAVAQTKVDAAYSVGSWAASYNGAASLTNSYAGVVPNQSQLIIGYTTAGGNPRLNGTIKRIAYYPRRLSNTEIQGITL